MRFQSKRGQNEKKCVSQFKKINKIEYIYIIIYLFIKFLNASSLALHFKDDLLSLRRCSYDILNYSKSRRIYKDLAKCLVIHK